MKKYERTWKGICLQAVLLFSTCLYSFEPVQPGAAASILYWAELLVAHITADNTGYRHKNIQVTWEHENSHDSFQSFADCSGFINALLKKTYQLDDAFFKRWLGKARPLAYQYYDAIVAGNRFKNIVRAADIRPGDLLVIRYNDRSEHEDNTGHCMLAAAAAEKIEGKDQYSIAVIDASKSPHGSTDTRHNVPGEPYGGTGKGVFRLYTDKYGTIKGYSWSLGKPRPGFDPFANPLVTGRLIFDQ